MKKKEQKLYDVYLVVLENGAQKNVYVSVDSQHGQRWRESGFPDTLRARNIKGQLERGAYSHELVEMDVPLQ